MTEKKQHCQELHTGKVKKIHCAVHSQRITHFFNLASEKRSKQITSELPLATEPSDKLKIFCQSNLLTLQIPLPIACNFLLFPIHENWFTALTTEAEPLNNSAR